MDHKKALDALEVAGLFAFFILMLFVMFLFSIQP